MQLVAGLGNPDQRYEKTRHNAGFMICDALAVKLGFFPWKNQKKSKVVGGNAVGLSLLLAKPQTYMNLSGDAILSLSSFYRIKPEDILIIMDDLALPFGRIRFRPGGSDGGHNGLADIIKKLGRDDIARMRIGIGQPPPYMDAADYVLSRFNSDEEKQWPEITDRCVEALLCYFKNGMQSAMNRFNQAS